MSLLPCSGGRFGVAQGRDVETAIHVHDLAGNAAGQVGEQEGRRIANIELNEISKVLLMQDQFVWIGLHEPSEALLSQVQEQFGLHDLAIEDAHNAHQRPKIESYGDTIFIVLRTAQINTAHHIDFGETHFFVGANFLVTVRHGSSKRWKRPDLFQQWMAAVDALVACWLAAAASLKAPWMP